MCTRERSKTTAKLNTRMRGRQMFEKSISSVKIDFDVEEASSSRRGLNTTAKQEVDDGFNALSVPITYPFFARHDDNP